MQCRVNGPNIFYLWSKLLTFNTHKLIKQFNRENCANVVRREVVTNRFGDKVTLTGRYAYEWSVVITPHYGPTKCFTFQEGRKAALKYFNMIKKAYNNSNR